VVPASGFEGSDELDATGSATLPFRMSIFHGIVITINRVGGP
jgi:hypothetical protein